MADKRKETQNTYLAREILQQPPTFQVKPDIILMQQADEGNTIPTLLKEIMKRKFVAVLLPVGFEDQYRNLMQGEDIQSLVRDAFHALGPQVKNFITTGAVWQERAGPHGGNKELGQLLVMEEEVWQRMAKKSLIRLAGMSTGAALLGLSEERYRMALHHEAGHGMSASLQIIENLVTHTHLTKGDIAKIRSAATTSDNFEFIKAFDATLAAKPPKQRGRGE